MAMQPNHCLTAAGTAVATTTTNIKTVNAVTYTVDGVLKSITAAANITPTAAADLIVNPATIIPNGHSCLFVVVINSAGAYKLIQGDVMWKTSGTPVDLGGRDTSGNLTTENRYQGMKVIKRTAGVATFQPLREFAEFTSQFLPAIPAGYVPAAVVKVAATADFIPGTTAWTGVSTFYDVSMLPEQTQL